MHSRAQDHARTHLISISLSENFGLCSDQEANANYLIDNAKSRSVFKQDNLIIPSRLWNSSQSANILQIHVMKGVT